MSFSQLPGEVVARIVDHVLHDVTVRGEAPQDKTSPQDKKGPRPDDTRDQARVLRAVNKMCSLAVHHCQQRDFHTFQPQRSPIVRGRMTEWMPTHRTSLQEDLDYWRHHLLRGTSAPTLPQLSFDLAALARFSFFNPATIRVDVRAADYISSYSACRPNQVGADRWACASKILDHIAKPNSALKKLHLRVSICQDTCYQLEQILRDHPNLTDVVIEADIPAAWNYIDRPILDLDRTQSPNVQYASIERFVIRAPGVTITSSNSDRLFDRLKSCTIFCMAVHSIRAGATVPVHHWVQRLLTNLQRLERAEVSVGEEDRSIVADKNDVGPCNLTHLSDLTLDLHDINVDLLSWINAPLLKHIRLRSQYDISHRGRCKAGHFPQLVSASVNCPGLILARFRTLGWALQKCVSALPDVSDSSVFDGECHVLIMKKRRALAMQRKLAKRQRLSHSVAVV
ncbi:hypothetical protein OC834_002096 [Tilletia horrida]|uniref:Uncharacterized protein n=1 Tax=Tilletia horrida TaxID=155126 RepID=A0AAN6JGW6_9BASI|nr:hypothetical protein OC842_007299 [Tilletia horrida]KAK0532516.1 hypothetical protein OC835_003314 [Tilletia horrida]KAK0533840.1 hypothetical protein OC834_002096 [Tilletia horrida]